MMRYIKNKIGMLALFCVLIVLFMPYQALAQDTAQAVMQARMDAQRDANGVLWFIMGILFGVIPLIIAYIIEPSPPMGMLMGKSPEYVAVYTETYTAEVKSIRTRNALYGCLTTALIETALYLLVFSSLFYE